MAGTIVANAKIIKGMVEITLDCRADAAAATFDAVVLNGLSGVPDILGLKLYNVKAWPGSTAPTDATDLTITDAEGIDILGGRGTDLIDATTMTSCCAGSINTEMPMPIMGPITINITNNAVNAAVIKIKLLFVP
jgi:hypothetical protein